MEIKYAIALLNAIGRVVVVVAVAAPTALIVVASLLYIELGFLVTSSRI